MSKLASSLITYIEKTGLLDSRAISGKKLIWNACYVPNIENLSSVISIQGFKPYYKNWEKAGINLFPTQEDNSEFDSVYCILPKQKEAAQYQLAKSADLLKTGGLLVAISENESGGKRLKKWFEELGFDPASVAKSKCKIVWAYKENLIAERVLSWTESGSEKTIQTSYGDFITKPGIYGWKKTDKGSEILIDYVPENLEGVGADFGCGYGLLSRAVFLNSNEIQKLYAIDADYNALDCCRKNLLAFENKVDFSWEDLTKPIENLPYLDWIVMNPPFHEGKEMQASIGQNFIQQASIKLKSNGVLYMVANAHLPYEAVLDVHFKHVEKLIEKDGFKVFKAVK